MAQYKCKRCGNLIEVENGAIIAVCDNCLLAQPIVADNMTIAPENKPASTNADVADEIQPLVRRAFLFLEDGEWEKADEYFERILDKKPECAEAYLGKIMTQFRVSKREDLINCGHSIKGNHYDKIMRFGDDKIKAEIKTVADAIENRIAPRVKPDKIENLEQEEIETTEYETAVEVNVTTDLEGEIEAENPSKKMLLRLIAVLLSIAVALGDNYSDECDVGNWVDIAASSASDWYTVELDEDSTLVFVGNNDYGQCDVSSWSDIKIPQ